MRINKNTIFLLISFAMLLSPIIMIPSVHSAEIQETNDLKSSQMLSNPIRVAIYDEANTTRPSYTGVGSLTSNFSNIQTALLAAGYEVTPLTTNQIYNHELKTARYDVFVMVDQLPKTNITNYVTEYWLGGGALLSLDSAISFICYAGILPPVSAGDDGFMTYWDYIVSSSHNITTRHPISRSYAVNGSFDTYSGDFATFSWSALQGTSIASEVVRVATISGNADDATVVGYDPQSGGGKVVHISTAKEIEDDAILIDAIEWLCPRPKGRILFDLSHHSFYGIDSWDDVVSSTNYGIWRNTLVSRGYTIDKLYPSATGNLTTSNLLPYDMLFLCIPEYNFTANEVTAVTQWVDDGGGLIAIGEHSGFADENNNINYLYGNYDLKMVSVTGTSGATYFVEHPTTEGCTEISASGPGTINYSGDAFPIWGYDATEISVAGQEYGNGRVLLMSDVAPFRDSGIGDINDLDNLQYAINTANWLTASEAEVLIFIQDHSNPSPNDNIYRGPVATALNELGISFHMTFTEDYLNLSLADSSYKLVVIDNTMSTIMDTVGMSLLNFLKSGGYLIVDTWTYRNAAYNYLWDYLGFSYAGNYISISPPIVNIWNPSHAIFSNPANYGADTIETTLNFAATDYTNLTLHSNATSIAGLTLTPGVSGGAIIIGANGHAISNALHLTEYYDDTDDSTYPDGLEIWTNEIAFMWAQIVAGTPGTPGIPGYDVYLISFTIVFSIGVISVLKIRKIRKN